MGLVSLDHLGAAFEVKAVDAAQRIVEGYAAVFGNLDRVGDVIDRKAFDRTLREQGPGDIDVFVAHRHDDLPIGECLEIRADDRGLYTKTRILEGADGDRLLAGAARGRLGLSIGYRAREQRREQQGGKAVRRLLDIDLGEYSYAAKGTIANPLALVTAVKTDGGSMDVDSLPDSAFAYVEVGEKDTERKTVPRTKRHFPHHDTDGAVDPDAVRAQIDLALASPLAETALPHLLRHAAGAEDAADPVWTAGAAPALLVLAHDLARLGEKVADQQRAMVSLGDETKAGWATRATARQELRELGARLSGLIDRAEGADTGTDAHALAEWWDLQRTLLEV